jgi:hypothetical protein
MESLFKVFLGHKAVFSVSSLEGAKALAAPLLTCQEPVRIERLGTGDTWVYNAAVAAWEQAAAPKNART